MKKTSMFMAIFLMSGFSQVCAAKEDKPATAKEQSKKTEALKEKAETKKKDADKAMEDYTYAQKKDFVEKMKKELAATQKEMDQLTAKIEKSRTETKAEAKIKLDAMQKKLAEAKKDLTKAENADESAWHDMKNGFKKTFSDLQDSYNKTRQWLSDKIEPE